MGGWVDESLIDSSRIHPPTHLPTCIGGPPNSEHSEPLSYRAFKRQGNTKKGKDDHGQQPISQDGADSVDEKVGEWVDEASPFERLDER